MRERAVALVCLLLLSSLSTIAATPEEDTNFQETHTGVDFPVGYVDFDQQSGSFEPEHRLVYPALNSGEDQEMAGNGPFPWVLLLIDENESPDNYMLVSTRIAQRGTMVYIHSELNSDTTPTWQSLIESILDVQTWMSEANQTNDIVLGMYGAVDESHWGLIGHGYGATWATNVYINWDNLIEDDTLQPPVSYTHLTLPTKRIV